MPTKSYSFRLTEYNIAIIDNIAECHTDNTAKKLSRTEALEYILAQFWKDYTSQQGLIARLKKRIHPEPQNRALDSFLSVNEEIGKDMLEAAIH